MATRNNYLFRPTNMAGESKNESFYLDQLFLQIQKYAFLIEKVTVCYVLSRLPGIDF